MDLFHSPSLSRLNQSSPASSRARSPRIPSSRRISVRSRSLSPPLLPLAARSRIPVRILSRRTSARPRLARRTLALLSCPASLLSYRSISTLLFLNSIAHFFSIPPSFVTLPSSFSSSSDKVVLASISQPAGKTGTPISDANFCAPSSTISVCSVS